MKVLIAGAGVAGNALAFWLVRLGHEVTIIERYPSLRLTGLQIDLRGHGVAVLKKMGLDKAYRALSPPEQGAAVVNSAGRRIGYFPANKTGEGLQSFTTDWEIMRGDFCRLMYDATKDRARYLFGTSITRLTNTEKSVQVDFAHGTSETFDLVVGADGVNSRTRALIGKDGFKACKGQFIAYMTLPEVVKEGEGYDNTTYMGKRTGMMLRRNSPDYLQIYMMCMSEDRELVDAKRGSNEEKRAFGKVMRGAGYRVDEFLGRFDEIEDFYCERLGIVELESWSLGRVTLLGDAGYCASANTGMGTTSALVGAYVLAGEIGRSGKDIPKALEAYEATFMPFMSQVQKGVLDQMNMFPSSALGVWVVEWAVSLASWFRMDLIAKYVLGEAKVKNWKLPEYEALEAAMRV